MYIVRKRSVAKSYNANRQKNKKALKLWKKKSTRIADIDVVYENLSIVKEVEKNEGKDWIAMLYEKNGIKKGGGVNGKGKYVT